MIRNGFYRQPAQLKARDLEFVCYGLPRSGSTLVYQFISSLYRRGVAKVHRYCPEPVRTTVSYRDFRDLIVSQWRVADPEHIRRKMTRIEVETYAARCLDRLQELDCYRERDDACLLRYEEFAPDPMAIFDALRSTFGIVVEPAKAARLIRKFSIERNLRIARRFRTFQQHDEKTQIHGRHIYKGEIGGWRDFVADRDAARFERMLKPALVRYGYVV
jgi:hypothetical protein